MGNGPNKISEIIFFPKDGFCHFYDAICYDAMNVGWDEMIDSWDWFTIGPACLLAAGTSILQSLMHRLMHITSCFYFWTVGGKDVSSIFIYTHLSRVVKMYSWISNIAIMTSKNGISHHTADTLWSLKSQLDEQASYPVMRKYWGVELSHVTAPSLWDHTCPLVSCTHMCFLCSETN